MATAFDQVIVTRSVAGERPVYTWGALAAILVAFAGFAPTYYLTSVLNGPPLDGLRHVHGAVMTLWLGLFLAQARLVAAGRVDLHRQLGIAGVLAAVMVVAVGTSAGIASARAGFAPPGMPPLVFLVLPLGEMVAFTALVGTALAMRRRRDWHKRLMLVATFAMLTPAFARLSRMAFGDGTVIPPLFFLMTDSLIVAAALYDRHRNGRFHPAFVAGLVFVMVVQFGRIAVARTDAWMAFARWLVA